MGIVPPYMSKQIENYYKKTGQTDLLELQRSSNENIKQLRDKRRGARDLGLCDRIGRIVELVKNKFLEFTRAVSFAILPAAIWSRKEVVEGKTDLKVAFKPSIFDID